MRAPSAGSPTSPIFGWLGQRRDTIRICSAREDWPRNGPDRMEDAIQEVVLKRFENPMIFALFEKGRFDLLRIGAITIARGHYEPGWLWSEHVGKSLRQKECM